MTPKKAWLISPCSPAAGASIGGVKTHTELLSSLLRAEGFSLTVIVPEIVSSGGDCIGVKTADSVSEPHTRVWKDALKTTARSLLSTGKPDLIISEGYMAAGLEGFAKDLKVPLVAFVHNFHLVHFFNKTKEITNPRTLARYIFLTVPQLAARIIASELPFFRSCAALLPVSEFNSALLAKAYRIDENTLLPFYNWVEEDYFKREEHARHDIRSGFGISEEEVVVLMAGSAWAPKGFRQGLAAYEAALLSGLNIKLLMAGTGANRSFAEANLKNRAALSGITALGPVSRSRLAQLYQAADIFLQPSLISEGCSYTMIEAMASGLPIITTAVGGNPEIPHGAAELARPSPALLGTSLLKLAADPALRKALGEKSKLVSGKYFTEEAARLRLRKLLETLNIF